MNCVGIDVSKGKSMIAVMRPLGEMVIPPFEVGHTDVELCELSRLLKKLDGETRVVMGMFGVGPALGPQLMAEISDVRRFHSKKALVAFAGIDAPPYQSGPAPLPQSFSAKGRHEQRGDIPPPASDC